MSVRGLFGLVLGLILLAACGRSGAVRPRAESIPVPDDSPMYMSAARPDGAVGGPGIEQLQAEVTAALAERGERALPDGALSGAAAWALREMNQMRPFDLVALDAASRHFGFGGVVFGFVGIDMEHREVFREQLARTPANLPITRFGIRVSPSGRSAAVAFGSVEIDYEPFPRALEPGQSVTLNGQVSSRFTFCRVYLTKPDGSVEERPMPDRRVAVTFPLPAQGRYRLEVMGDGPTGPVVVANVPLFVGIPEPSAAGISGAVVEPEQAEARALVLLNEARRVAGVGPVQPDAALRELALAHSEDMVDHDFFSHVSPSTGSPPDRLRRSGLVLAKFGENISFATTPELVHEGLMESPGHRANMLDRAFTHVGIGAKKNDNGLVVTMAFGRRPDASAVPTTSAQVEAAILALRAGKSLSVASADPVYRAGAQAGVEALVKGADEEDINRAIGDALQREVNRLQTTRPGACSISIELLELSQLNELPMLALPALRRFGVGTRFRRDDKGTRLTTLLMLEGVPCNVPPPSQ